MKKLLLLSLILFAALVFQSCKKVSYGIDEEIVPIVFSQTQITKADKAVVSLDALVLGSKVKDDWSTANMYFSSETISGTPTSTLVKNYAKGKFRIVTNSTSSETFTPIVAYPFQPAGDTAPIKGVYIKALVPHDKIEGIDDVIADKTTGLTEVIFTIDGETDIMATGLTRAQTGFEGELVHGYGTRGDPNVDLVFEHLLSKIKFYIVAENEKAVTDYWGNFLSITFVGGHTRLKYTLNVHSIDFVQPEGETEPNGRFTVPSEPNPTPITIPFFTALITSPTPEQIVATRRPACEMMVYPLSGTYTIIVKTQKLPAKEILSEKVLNIGDLRQGMQHDITITFHENKKLGFSVKITPWETGKDDTPQVI